MTINTNDLLNSILESISKIDYVKSIDIPNIDLYMDQVTTFMDKQMASSKRYEEDKVLTKTMINNYAKNNLLPSPEKKKYTKEHLLVLTFIYCLELSISRQPLFFLVIVSKFFRKRINEFFNDLFLDIHIETECANERKQLQKFTLLFVLF